MEAVVSTSPAPPPPPPPPTPSHHRRPRVREVSSRFMSPAVSSVQRRSRPHQSEPDPLCCADENRPINNSESPLPMASQCKATVSTRKHRAVKLLKENNGGGGGGGRAEQQPHPSKSFSGRIGNSAFITPSRPDTPTVNIPSRFRLSQQCFASHNATAATKLLQSSGMSLPSSLNQLKVNVGSPQKEAISVSIDHSSMGCDDENRNSVISCSTRSLPELRSSMSEGDMVPTVSSRVLADKIGKRGNVNSSGDCLKFPASPCSRSLNFSSSSDEQSLFNSIKGIERPVSGHSKPCTNSIKMGGLSLPPVPPCAKMGIDSRKGKKGSSHQEDVHSLRLLHNRYLQWRYANARAESSMQTKQKESERALYSLGVKISELYNSVKRKRIELGILQRAKSLSTILEAQIPYLDQWSALEGDYSVSLTEVIGALLNASLQLPVSGNIKVDIREMEEALNSAMKVMQTIALHVQRFVLKGEETDNCISELARVVSGERVIVAECGDLLSKTYRSQVEECSLRGQLIQLYRSCRKD
ncbi:QWRF motif-containing protein 2-like [Quillaja saponaria]|uniref:QWRF motif-containing protein 2-like n=1 Tax=Quillaja saponaria TaxID=32244 RepID=A0AAD7M0X0_QUISA|nr:QWRF motif-containing protein 2-like [Quillaja saponaria]